MARDGARALHDTQGVAKSLGSTKDVIKARAALKIKMSNKMKMQAAQKLRKEAKNSVSNGCCRTLSRLGLRLVIACVDKQDTSEKLSVPVA